MTELNIPFIDIHKEVLEKEENPFKLFPFELSFHYNVKVIKSQSSYISSNKRLNFDIKINN